MVTREQAIDYAKRRTLETHTPYVAIEGIAPDGTIYYGGFWACKHNLKLSREWGDKIIYHGKVNRGLTA